MGEERRNQTGVIWENLDTHGSAAMQSFIDAHPGWLTVVRLPACAPDLNLTEGIWPDMKNGLGNLAAGSAGQLAAIAKNRLKASSTGPGSSMPSSPRPDSPSGRHRHQTLAFQPL